MKTIEVWTAFARKNAKACESACGFVRRAAYVYEQEETPGRNMRPQRLFVDSLGNEIKQGSGFPALKDPLPDLSAVGGSELLCLNAEYYGPEWERVPPPMRALGLNLNNGNRTSAQERLVRKLIGFAKAARAVGKAAGLYDFAPWSGCSDERLRVLQYVTAYFPCCYAPSSDNVAWIKERIAVLAKHTMPRREIVPIVRGLFTYETGLLSVEAWRDVLAAIAGLPNLKRVIWWEDCEAPESDGLVMESGERMRDGARAAGIELV